MLETTIQEMDEHEKVIQKIIKETNFTKLYSEFEKKYNPYPVQMSRAEAFGHAQSEGLISNEVYEAARRYYKNLWYYVGD